jgi:heme/copper-type cytochrome/quinol oxidase subunit 3
MNWNWERIHEESQKTLSALLNYIAAGVVIFGAIILAYFVNKNQYYPAFHNRVYAIIGIGLMVVGTLGNKLTKEQKAFTAVFTNSLLVLFYSMGTFCITLSKKQLIMS